MQIAQRSYMFGNKSYYKDFEPYTHFFKKNTAIILNTTVNLLQGQEYISQIFWLASKYKTIWSVLF